MWRTKQLRVNKKRHCGSDFLKNFTTKQRPIPFFSNFAADNILFN